MKVKRLSLAPLWEMQNYLGPNDYFHAISFEFGFCKITSVEVLSCTFCSPAINSFKDAEK